MKLRPIITLSLLALTMAACSRSISPAPAAETSAPSPEPSIVETPVSPLATPMSTPTRGASPLPDPASSPIEPPSEAVDQAVAAARDRLAEELGVAPDDLAVTVIEPVEWPDASLGCPKSGEVYAQVITPGYRIVLEVDDRDYELHTDQSARRIRICELRRRSEAEVAVAFLADELGVPAEDIEVLSVEMYEWPDASLGCPEPGKSYAQVVTEGYRILLRAKEEEYEVRTEREGRITVLCEAGP